MNMAAMITSYLPTVSDGISPSQSCEMIAHSIFIRAQRSFAKSISKPASWPSALVKFHGA